MNTEHMLERHEENQAVLAEVARVLPIVQAALEQKVSIAVSDDEKILLYMPAKDLDLHVEINSPIRKGAGLFQITHEKVPQTTKGTGLIFLIDITCIAITRQWRMHSGMRNLHLLLSPFFYSRLQK